MNQGKVASQAEFWQAMPSPVGTGLQAREGPAVERPCIHPSSYR